MQKVRSCAFVYIASTACRQLVSDLFHSPPGVLFTFPSRYSFTIGHQVVFSLTRWSGQIPAEFHVLCGTRVPSSLIYLIFAYEALTLYGCPFQNYSTNKIYLMLKTALFRLTVPQHHFYNTSRLLHKNGLGSSRFAHHYSGNHFVFSS